MGSSLYVNDPPTVTVTINGRFVGVIKAPASYTTSDAVAKAREIPEVIQGLAGTDAFPEYDPGKTLNFKAAQSVR